MLLHLFIMDKTAPLITFILFDHLFHSFLQCLWANETSCPCIVAQVSVRPSGFTVGNWNPRSVMERDGSKAKAWVEIGDLRSPLGSVSKLCDLMQGSSFPHELTHKIRELGHMVPNFFCRSELLGYLSLPDHQSAIRFGIRCLKMNCIDVGAR